MSSDCSSPEIILCGLEPQIRTLLDIYKFNKDQPIVVIGYGRESSSQEICGFPVKKLSALTLDNLQTVILLTPSKALSSLNEIGYKDSIDYFKTHDIGPEKLVYLNQPGKIFRAIQKFIDPAKVDIFRSAYKAIFLNLFPKYYYAFGVMLATEEARRLGRKSVTLVEAGVWNGYGLLNLCELADFLNLTQGMEYKIIGLDTGKGLPELKDWRDHPEIWSTGGMAMPDPEELKKRLPPYAELILGDVKETVPQLLAEEKISKDSPLGFLSIDVDIYSSTVDLLKIFDAKAETLLPATVVWVDDSFVCVLSTNFAGEALAISEFNASHELRKIDHKIVRSNRPPEPWHHGFYFCHVFDHPVRQGKEKARLFDFFDFNY